MACRIDGPLFGSTASGTVNGLPTFRQTPRGVFAVRRSPGPATPPAGGAGIRVEFATAHAAWVKIWPSDHVYNGKLRYMRWPAWPDYWRQWLVENGIA